MLEVELKCPLTAEMWPKLQIQLQRMSKLSVKSSIDRYYDTPHLEFLRHPRSVFVRLREERHLQVKFDECESDDEQIPCVERGFLITEDHLPEEAHLLVRHFMPRWQAASTWTEAVKRNELEVLACIQKTRVSYTDGTMLISVDRVAGLGDFVEAEIQCDEGTDTQSALTRVQMFLSELGGKPLRAGYTELWLYQHHPQAYEQVPARFRVNETDLQ
ncbi:MAG TPA: CYTH domain-containing protein [Ktedonosporobacter sp.]|nr:CYTH domain-containing protein [Ktedonosporobacter sp.]